MVKRLLFALLVMAALLLPAAALAEVQVVDDAEILTAQEEERIAEAINWMEERAEIDVVVLTTRDTPRDDTYSMKYVRDYADDYYDYRGYGRGEQNSGMLFLVDMNNRIMWISTSGTMIKTINDDRVDALLDAAYSEMSSGNYGDAILRVMKKTQRYVYNTISWVDLLIAAAGFAVTAGLMVSGVSASYNLKGSTYCYDLQANSTSNITMNEEEYLRQRVSRVARSSGSGGGSGRSGSSTHRSSSGRSHGGGGRRF